MKKCAPPGEGTKVQQSSFMSTNALLHGTCSPTVRAAVQQLGAEVREQDGSHGMPFLGWISTERQWQSFTARIQPTRTECMVHTVCMCSQSEHLRGSLQYSQRSELSPPCHIHCRNPSCSDSLRVSRACRKAFRLSTLCGVKTCCVVGCHTTDHARPADPVVDGLMFLTYVQMFMARRAPRSSQHVKFIFGAGERELQYLNDMLDPARKLWLCNCGTTGHLVHIISEAISDGGLGLTDPS